MFHALSRYFGWTSGVLFLAGYVLLEFRDLEISY